MNSRITHGKNLLKCLLYMSGNQCHKVTVNIDSPYNIVKEITLFNFDDIWHDNE